jgi:Ribbon-helix-helix protein, copG family
MKGGIAGIVIRTAFNNQGWSGRCKNPLNDSRCFKCREGGLYINKGNPIEEGDNGFCKGETEDYPLSYPISDNDSFWCWEQVLCVKYFWGNVKGKWRNVVEGMPAYFVYSEFGNTLTLWGHSVIERIDNEPEKYPPIYFKPFEPLPLDKWVKGLTGDVITGKSWRQLHYRYLDENHENYLASLISGKEKHEHRKNFIHQAEQYESLEIKLKRDIKEKLEKIARVEGREVNELIREAVAKIIRDRGF